MDRIHHSVFNAHSRSFMHFVRRGDRRLRDENGSKQKSSCHFSNALWCIFKKNEAKHGRWVFDKCLYWTDPKHASSPGITCWQHSKPSNKEVEKLMWRGRRKLIFMAFRRLEAMSSQIPFPCGYPMTGVPPPPPPPSFLVLQTSDYRHFPVAKNTFWGVIGKAWHTRQPGDRITNKKKIKMK